MELYTPRGQFYTKQINTNAKNGFYAFTVPTKNEDPTGTWHAYFKIGGATFHKPFRIESIKPNRLKINLDLEGKTIDGGRNVPVCISADWLTYSPAAGLAAKVNMTLRQARPHSRDSRGITSQVRCRTSAQASISSSTQG